MHALVLKSHGHNVVVLEMRTEQQMKARAAGLSLWSNAHKLLQTYIPDIDLDDIVIRNPSFPIMDKNGKVSVDVPITEDVRTSCWAGIHGLLWMACERDIDGHGTVTIQCGSQVTGLTDQGDHVVVAYKSKDGTEDELAADFVIGADGARSQVRNIVLPDVKTEYVGYLAWRSYFSERDVPEELRSVVDGKMPQCMLDGSYLVVYVSNMLFGTTTNNNVQVSFAQ